MKLFDLFSRKFPQLTQLAHSEKTRLIPHATGAMLYATGILTMSNYLKNNYPQPNHNDWEENIDGAMRPKFASILPKNLSKPPT